MARNIICCTADVVACPCMCLAVDSLQRLRAHTCAAATVETWKFAGPHCNSCMLRRSLVYNQLLSTLKGAVEASSRQRRHSRRLATSRTAARRSARKSIVRVGYERILLDKSMACLMKYACKALQPPAYTGSDKRCGEVVVSKAGLA